MGRTETPPEQLSERELFAEFVELLDEPDESAESREGYSEARLRARRADLLAEIGDRLEALEAAKALLGGTESEHETAPRHEREVDQEL